MTRYSHDIGRVTGYGQSRREARDNAEDEIAAAYEHVMRNLELRPVVHAWRNWIGVAYFSGRHWGWLVTAAYQGQGHKPADRMPRAMFNPCISRDQAIGSMLFNLAQLGYSTNDGVAAPEWIPQDYKQTLEDWQAWQQRYSLARRNGWSHDQAFNIANGHPADGPGTAA